MTGRQIFSVSLSISHFLNEFRWASGIISYPKPTLGQPIMQSTPLEYTMLPCLCNIIAQTKILRNHTIKEHK